MGSVDKLPHEIKRGSCARIDLFSTVSRRPCSANPLHLARCPPLQIFFVERTIAHAVLNDSVQAAVIVGLALKSLHCCSEKTPPHRCLLRDKGKWVRISAC